MGDRSMRACLDEQLDVLRNAARTHSACGFSVQRWYDDGADLAVLLEVHDDGVHATPTYNETTHAVIYAWGYLEGAADMADLTVSELLALHELTFESTPEGRRRRKVAR